MEANTVMTINTLVRHLRESFKSFGRNGWMTFASISAVTMTLLLVGVFLIIMSNLSGLANNIEKDVEIKVTLEPSLSEEEVKEIKEEVERVKGIAAVKHSTKDEELDKMIGTLGEEFALYKTSNPLGDVLYVKAKHPHDTASIAEEIAKNGKTYEVAYGEGKVEKLFNVLKTSRNVGAVLIIGLLIIAMFLISNTIRLTINARGTEIEIMKLVGATNNFVRIPFILEGIWIGVVGAVLPIVAITIGYNKLYQSWAPQLQDEIFQMASVSPLIWQISIVLLLIGIGIGIWGSFISVRRFLKV